MSWAALRRCLAIVVLMTAAATTTAAPASAAEATLTVTPGEARLGEAITIIGSGFELCTEPPQVEFLGLATMTLIAQPAGIELPTIAVAESFTGQGRVSPEAAAGGVHDHRVVPERALVGLELNAAGKGRAVPFAGASGAGLRLRRRHGGR